jgi:flagellar hook assembly protein FlgD
VAPNPCNPRTRITWWQPRAGPATVTVYDLAGRRVRTLHAGERAAGRHAVDWQGDDRHGRRAPAGLYLVRVQAAGRSVSRVVTVVN